LANLSKILVISILFFGEWSVYRPDDNSFTIEVPGKYELSTDTISTELGMIPVTLIHHRCKLDNYCFHDDPHSIYAMVHMDYPIGTFPADSTEMINAFLDETIENRRTEIGEDTILDYQADLDQDDYHGRIVRYTSPSRKALCKAKFIIYDDRLIALQVVSDKKQIQRKEVRQFLDSFRPNDK